MFERMAAEAAWRATLTGAGEAVPIRGVRVSPHYLDIFGAKAALGRTFLPGEDQAGSDRVVLLEPCALGRAASAPTPPSLDGTSC